MDCILTIIRFLLFYTASIGWWELLRRKTQINIYFLPSIVVAAQVSLLFLGGILNFLHEAALLLYVAGLFFFGLFVYKDKSIAYLKQYGRVGYLFLLITCAFLLLYVRGKIFTDYDNFSHWATVVKLMLTTDRYPNFLDSIIMFQEYPLGASTYIYFFSTLVGRSEPLQMFAQAYITQTALLPIFIYCRKNKWLACLWMVIASNFILLFNAKIVALLVDTLLPVVSMCALLYIYTYGKDLKRFRLEAYLSMFYVVFIIQIKNSGLFFAAIASLLTVVSIRDDRRLIDRVTIAFAPYASLLIWRRHCSYVFLNASITKHAMTINNFVFYFLEKTAEDIKQISADMLRFTLTWKTTGSIFLILIFVGLLTFIFAKSHRKAFIRAFVFCALMYLVYQVCVLCMYLLSMPLYEAVILAGHERYTWTVLIAIVYVSLVLFMNVSSEMDTIPAGISGIILTGLLVLANNGKAATIFSYNPSGEERMWFESAAAKYNVPPSSSYCFLIPADDGGYTYFLGEYIFQTNEITVLASATEADLSTVDDKYIFNYDPDNTEVRNWLSANFPEQAGNAVTAAD